MYLVLLLVLVAGYQGGAYQDCGHRGEENAEAYTNEWVVRLEGGPQVAQLVAMQMGYTYKGPVSGFADTYRMVKEDHPQINKRGHSRLTQRFTADTRVLWAEQQFAKQRDKRGVVPPTPDVIDPAGVVTRVKRFDLSIPYRGDRFLFNDELWDQQWYMHDTRTRFDLPKLDLHVLPVYARGISGRVKHDTRTRFDLPKLDLHVLPVYARGISGRGVRVTVLDDGLEYTHEDLRKNYDPEISYDVNDDDPDPMPRYDGGQTNQHGTRCAGEIAMTANNGKCGVGVAFNSKIGGIRFLDGMVNDRMEGMAMGFAYDKVDIYSASWGPTDNGRTLEGPGRLASEALERGVVKGRGGKGVIFVWASGNGGSKGDDCNCDGYITSIYTLAIGSLTGRGGKGVIFVWASGNGGSKGDDCNCDGYITSIYTLAIGSASQQGHFPWYGEQCASTLAAAYSSGAYTDQMIVTADLHNQCTTRHTGTSAAAPLAAGIIALALEVNPELTWRDVQHLVVWTSEWAPLQDNRGWQRNAAGFWINTRFGFGLMNADALVTAASNWTNVPDKAICTMEANPVISSTLIHGSPFVLEFHSSGCQGTDDEIRILEHVQVVANIHYPQRGVLQVSLTSPQGTKVPLLRNRKSDNSSAGFVNWQFMSVLTWGERPDGIWTVEILDKDGTPGQHGSVGVFTLLLHGTKDTPAYLCNGPRQYDENYNSLHRKNSEQGFGRPLPRPTSTTVDAMKMLKAGDRLEWSDLVNIPIVVQNDVRRQTTRLEMLTRLFSRNFLQPGVK